MNLVLFKEEETKGINMENKMEQKIKTQIIRINAVAGELQKHQLDLQKKVDEAEKSYNNICCKKIFLSDILLPLQEELQQINNNIDELGEIVIEFNRLLYTQEGEDYETTTRILIKRFNECSTILKTHTYNVGRIMALKQDLEDLEAMGI